MMIVRNIAEWYQAHVEIVPKLFGRELQRRRCPAGCCDKVKAALQRKESSK